ncbi:MAG: nucleotidyltransferase domain-containing protein [Asticcacaulis sp.]
MMPASDVSAESLGYIRQRLAELADSEGVRILFAIESGSRAWGFPSADSDYDVRFVYVRPRSDYLSVREFRDVIETPTLDDQVLGVPLDLNGWDLRKALRLGLSSNPVLHEWLKSPVVYGLDQNATSAIRDFAIEAADPQVFRYHYDRLCRSAWSGMQEPGGATIKRYCYALRPAMILLWLNDRDDLPPMDVHGLSSGLDIDEPVVRDIARLIRLKATGAEQDNVAAPERLNAFILAQLQNVAVRPARTDGYAPHLVATANKIFLNLLD